MDTPRADRHPCLPRASAGTVALRFPSPPPLCSTPGKQDHTQDRRLSLAPVAPTVPSGSVVGTALPSVPPPSKVCLSFLKLNCLRLDLWVPARSSA